MFPGNGLERLRVRVQFLFAVRQVNQRHHGEHHPLVTGGQIVQHFTRLFPLLFQVIRNNRREIVIVVLPPLPVGDIRFHAEQTRLHLPDRLVRGDGNHVNGQHHSTIQGR